MTEIEKLRLDEAKQELKKVIEDIRMHTIDSINISMQLERERRQREELIKELELNENERLKEQ